MPGIFHVSLPGGEPLGLVGPWQASSPVSFEAGAAPEDHAIWRVDLPEDTLAAQAALTEAESQLNAAAAALEQVPARLDALAAPAARAGGVSFDATSLSAEPGSPEAEMLTVLAYAQAAETGGPVSYGIEEFASQAWQQARAQFEAFLDQLEREVLNFAWVETSIALRLLARTAVGWGGDSSTSWLEDASAEEMQMHERALQVAVKTRLLRIRMFSTVAGGAAKLSLLLATPAGAVLALPAAWKYVTAILEQIKTYQTITQGG